MQIDAHPSLLWPKTATFLTAALAGLSAVYWALHLSSSEPNRQTTSVPSGVDFSTATSPNDSTNLGPLLGAEQATAGVVTAELNRTPDVGRFKLLGVLAYKTQEGYALIAIDGKPAKPYPVGATLEEGWILKSVAARSAILDPGTDEPTIVLQLSPTPATTTPPAAAGAIPAETKKPNRF